MLVRNKLLSSAAAVGLTACGGVFASAAQAQDVPQAQDTGQAQATATADDAGLGEIVVTAQKRSENLQKASASIDVVLPGDIAKSGIKNATDLQELVPSVKFSNADVMTVSIRGLGTTNVNPGVDAVVAYSQDGIYLSRPNALPPVLFDIARVEVVLGPQGTLYGRNSNGGVVNFITNDPVLGETSGHVQAQVGNYADVAGEAAINLPLGDTVALRISGGGERRDGYNKDGGDDAGAIAGRAKLLFSPSSDLRIILAADGSRRRTNGNTYGASCPPNTDLVANPGCVGVTYHPWEGLLPAAYQFNNNDQLGTSATIQYDMDWAQLTSLTGYRYFDFSGRTAPPGDNFSYNHQEKSHFFTQEVRLASTSASRVKWVLGAYYSHETSPANTTYIYGTNVPYPGAVADTVTIPVTDTKYTSFAVFGDLTYPVTDQFRLLGGLRYTIENKRTFGAFNDPGAGVSEAVGDKTEEKRLTWKAGFEYDLSPDSMLYFTASTGFKSGGANMLPVSAGVPTTYQPEEVTAKEIGLKSRFLDENLQVNVSAFHYAYSGYQTFTFYVTPTFLTVFPTLNSQKATFYGGELNLLARLSAQDTLGVHVNWLHDRYDEFTFGTGYATGSLTTVDYSGNKVMNAPDIRVGADFQHVFHLSDEDNLTVNLNSELTGPDYADNSNVLSSRNPTYTRSGASITYDRLNSGWSVTAFIRNIENHAVINAWAGAYPDPFSTDAGRINVMLDPPRTFGLSVRKDF